jgi:hypothetical protein
VQDSTGSVWGEVAANKGRLVSLSMSTGLWALLELEQTCHIKNPTVSECYVVLKLNTVLHVQCFASDIDKEHSFTSTDKRLGDIQR